MYTSIYSRSSLFVSFVVILIYTPYIYAYNDRYIRITLLEYYYIFIIVAIVAVIFILDVFTRLKYLVTLQDISEW